MKRLTLILYICLSFCVVSVHAQAPSRERLEAFKTYLLEKDYPEVFKEPYRARIENILDVDVDNDGVKELVVQFQPHFRQSPSIIIYKVGPKLELTRVTEALAPGPLQKLTGDYLDSHDIGMAVDIELQSARPVQEMVSQFRGHFVGVVAYDTFYHVHSRKGATVYLDMRHVKGIPKEHTCKSFEFATVKQIAAGGLREDPSKNYLASWVGNEIYVYLIRSIASDGLLDKQLTIIKAPAGFSGFEPNAGLTYKTASGNATLTLN